MSIILFREASRNLRRISIIIIILFSAIAITACTEDRKAQALFDSAELDMKKLSNKHLPYSVIYLYSKNAIEKINDVINQFPETQLAKELNANERLIAGKTLAQLEKLNRILNKEKEQEGDLFYLAIKVNAFFEDIEGFNEQLHRKAQLSTLLHSFGETEKAKQILTEAEKLTDYLIDPKDKQQAYTYIANAYINIGEFTKASYIADEKLRRLDESTALRPLEAYLGIKTDIAISWLHKNPAKTQEILLDLLNEVDNFNSKSRAQSRYSSFYRASKNSIIDAYLNIGDKDSALAIANETNIYPNQLVKLARAYIADNNITKANKLIELSVQGEHKALVMIELSNAYIEKGEKSKATEKLLEAYRLVESIKINKFNDILESSSAVEKAKLMTKIAGQLLIIEEDLRASQILDKALDTVNKYTPLYTSEVLAHIGAQYYKAGNIEKGNSLLLEALIDAKLETGFRGSATDIIFNINLELLKFKEALSILKDRTTPVDGRAYLFLKLAEKAAEKNQLDIVSSALSEFLQSYSISSIPSSHLVSYFSRMAKIIKEKNIELTGEQKNRAAYLLIEYYPLEKLLSDNALVTADS